MPLIGDVADAIGEFSDWRIVKPISLFDLVKLNACDDAIGWCVKELVRGKCGLKTRINSPEAFEKVFDYDYSYVLWLGDHGFIERIPKVKQPKVNDLLVDSVGDYFLITQIAEHAGIKHFHSWNIAREEPHCILPPYLTCYSNLGQIKELLNARD